MNKILQVLIFVLFYCYPFGLVQSQPCVNTLVNEPVPSKCFEIVSMLVDACDGSNEGKNEMIRLKIGPNPLLVSSLAPGPCTPGVTVNWGSGSGSNPFLGWANFNIADNIKIDTINKRIKAAGNCGILIPRNKTDFIPAGASLIIVTSTAYNPTAHDFSGLQDTLYVILQVADASGNQGGHFANFNASSATRKLVMLYGTCGDTVLYDISKLLNQSLVKGQEDGATVNYSFNGNATYSNSGCKIPITQQSIDAGIVPPIICAGGSISLNGSYTGNHCFAWRAENTAAGTFADSLNLFTTFNLKKSFIGTCKLYLVAKLNCKDYKDSVSITVLTPTDSIRIQAMDTIWCAYKQIPIKTISTSNAAVFWSSSGSGKIDFPNQFNIVYTPDTLKDTGIVVFKVTQNTACGTIEDSIRLTFVAADATFNPDQMIVCRGDEAFYLNPKQVGGVFYGPTGMLDKLQFNPTDTGIYKLTYVVSVLGCSDTVTKEIKVNGFYTDQVNTLNPSCFGMQNGSIQIDLLAGKPPFVFQWNNQINGLNQMQHLKAGNYHIQITDNDNCRDTFTVQLNEPQVLKLNKNLTQPTCGMNNGSILVQVIGGTLPYQYSLNNMPIFTNSIEQLNSGKYILTVVDNQACVIVDTSELQTSTPVIIATNVLTDTCNAYKGSVSVNIQSGVGPFSYNWTPYYAPNPSQNNIAGKSAGMVVVTDANRCIDTAYYEVPDVCKNQIWIANAFLPSNANNTNIQFGPVTAFPESILRYRFSIYNRWGQLVFESTDYKNRWDGRVNGIEAASDVYFYELQVRFQNESSEELLKGNVTLIR